MKRSHSWERGLGPSALSRASAPALATFILSGSVHLSARRVSKNAVPQQPGGHHHPGLWPLQG